MAIASKAPTKAKLKPQAERPAITITKTGTCKTLNGKSKLEYAVGTDAGNKKHYKVTANEGGGHHSKEWLAADTIQAALAKVEPITAYPLRALTAGRSVNTAGFILAVLVAECLLEKVPKKARLYRFVTPNSISSASPKKPSASSAKKSTKPAKK